LVGSKTKVRKRSPAVKGAVIKFLSKNLPSVKESMGHRAASAGPTDPLSEAPAVSAAVPLRPHQAWPQHWGRKTGGDLKLQSHYVDS